MKNAPGYSLRMVLAIALQLGELDIWASSTAPEENPHLWHFSVQTSDTTLTVLCGSGGNMFSYFRPHHFVYLLYECTFLKVALNT